MFDYIVLPNDTIYSITRQFGITTAQLLAINPEILDGAIAVGQTLRIPQIEPVRPVIEVNGYAYPTVSDEVLEETLPYLTYLSIMGYEVRADGTLSDTDDARLIEAARQKSVAPLMVVSNIDPDVGFSSELGHAILSDAVLYQTLINYIIATLKAKNYYGVNLNFTELYPSDYMAYAVFLQSLTLQLHPLGYIVVISPRIIALIEQQAAIIAVDASIPFNSILDRLILRSTNWECTYEYREVSFMDEMQQAIDFAIQIVSSPKILITIPNCCFEFKLADQQIQLERILSSAQADALVQQIGGVFRIDPRSRTSHFTYFGDDGMFREVLCQSDTNLRAPLDIVEAYNLGGVSFRTIEDFSFASYQMVTAEFEIRKVID